MAVNSARRNSGVQSVETGAILITALARAGPGQSLTQLAAMSGMPTAKAYRYLVSLCRSGLAVQDPWTARYDLGPLAGEIGQARLTHLDASLTLEQELGNLRDAVGETVCVFRWTPRGPTLTHVEQRSHAVTVRARVGIALPLLTTAAGRIYAAFGNSPDLRARIRSEVRISRQAGGLAKQRIEPRRIVAEVRSREMARIRGDDRVGVNAIAAPVFDAERRLCAAVSVIGDDHLDISWNSKNAALLREFVARTSTRTS